MGPRAHKIPEPVEKAGILAALAAFFFAGYFGIPQLHVGSPGIDLGTPLDRALPYVPAFGFAYAVCYVQVFAPAVLVPDHSLFRRAALAAAVVMAVAFVCFALLPVQVHYPPVGDTAGEWILRKNRLLHDHGFNAIPSLHVALATLSALSIHHARPAWRIPIWTSTVLIALSTVLVKRHFVVDVPAGALLGWAVHRVLLTDAILRWREARA